MKQVFTILILSSLTLNVFSQFATINAKVVFPDLKNTTNKISFNVNRHHFGQKDTTIKIVINKMGFDSCEAIIHDDTIKFLAKFKENQTYKIEQGCCCAAFTLTPDNNSNRGVIEFKNHTARNLGLIVCEHNAEIIKANKTLEIYASESAMCMYKPCSILITDSSYFSRKYEYRNAKIEDDKLSIEQQKYILTEIRFHFLHGEKIEVKYDDMTKKVNIKLAGYLTDRELKRIEK